MAGRVPFLFGALLFALLFPTTGTEHEKFLRDHRFFDRRTDSHPGPGGSASAMSAPPCNAANTPKTEDCSLGPGNGFRIRVALEIDARVTGVDAGNQGRRIPAFSISINA